MKKIIKHYPMTGRLIVTQGYYLLRWVLFSDGYGFCTLKYVFLFLVTNISAKKNLYEMLFIWMPIYFINIVRENQRGNQEWTFQRHWQHWTYKTQDEDKQVYTYNIGHTRHRMKTNKYTHTTLDIQDTGWRQTSK